MNRQTKILWLLLLLAVIASISITFYQTVILKNFDVIETGVEE